MNIYTRAAVETLSDIWDYCGAWIVTIVAWAVLFTVIWLLFVNPLAALGIVLFFVFLQVAAMFYNNVQYLRMEDELDESDEVQTDGK